MANKIGDPLATPLLLGLGLDEFSMAPISNPMVKASYSQSGTEAMPGNHSDGIRTAFNRGCKGVSQPIYCLIAYNLISIYWVVYHENLEAR
jgi:hypothetical protein